ncbi:MAG: hypothetical protein BRD51_05025 [Bacteroidetes bacterium SW_11_64_17]|nr:MAG: hypothetical protein BRD51_05025 [Bacteroidetes bacterium SW_11_64_17]
MIPLPCASRAGCSLFLVTLAAALWTGLPEARAQEFGRLQNMKERTNVAYFYFAPPGTATVQVQVQGTVPRPGIYEVADSTDLNKLLTMSGGAALEPRPENRDRPDITIRVYRPSDQSRAVVLEAPFEQILSGRKQFQQFRDGDVIVVETVNQRSFTWRDLLSVSSTTLSLVLLAIRIIRFRN